MPKKTLPAEWKGLREQQRPESDTPLAAWCRAHDISNLEMARRCRAHPKSVEAWAKGRQLPSLIYAFRLEQASDGGVPVSSWLGTELGQKMWGLLGSDYQAWRDSATAADKRAKSRKKGRNIDDAPQAAPVTTEAAPGAEADG